MQRASFYTGRDKLTSPKHKLHTFQVETSTVRNKDLLRNWCHNFRHLQHSCGSANFSGRYAQNYCSYCSSNIIEIWTIVLFFHSKNHGLRTNHIEALKKSAENFRKTGQHTLVQCTESQIVLKTGQEKLYPPTDFNRSASPCNVARNYSRSSLRIFFTAFLEIKTQLLKLM